MKLKNILPLSLFICSFIPIYGQVIKNSNINLNVLTKDSVRINSKSNFCTMLLNYQTGETTIKVKSETFNTNDSNLKKYFFQKKNELELHFIIPKNMLDFLTKDNNEHSAESAGMLYINGHFGNVTINYSIYNKNGNAIDFANNNVFFSFQCNFSPDNFQLDGLKSYTNEPVLIWCSKQPINFTNTN